MRPIRPQNICAVGKIEPKLQALNDTNTIYEGSYFKDSRKYLTDGIPHSFYNRLDHPGKNDNLS